MKGELTEQKCILLSHTSDVREALLFIMLIVKSKYEEAKAKEIENWEP